MSFFKRWTQGETPAAGEETAAVREGAAGSAGETAGGEAAAPEQPAPAQFTPGPPAPAATAPAAEQTLAADVEQQWREAAAAVDGHWPQVRENLPAVLARMKQISQRYGDESLWQRAPVGLMREAAVELYGMPPRPDAALLQGALRSAHEQGRQAALERRRSLVGLAPPQLSRSAPPPLSEEERIIRDIAGAKRGRLF